MANSTRRHAGAKSPDVVVDHNRAKKDDQPKKLRFPLSLYPTRQWAKKIKGHYRYLGKDKDKTLAEYMRVKDDLQAGGIPPPAGHDQATLFYLINAFMTHAKHKVRTGEITTRTPRTTTPRANCT